MKINLGGYLYLKMGAILIRNKASLNELLEEIIEEININKNEIAKSLFQIQKSDKYEEIGKIKAINEYINSLNTCLKTETKVQTFINCLQKNKKRLKS